MIYLAILIVLVIVLIILLLLGYKIIVVKFGLRKGWMLCFLITIYTVLLIYLAVNMNSNESYLSFALSLVVALFIFGYQHNVSENSDLKIDEVLIMQKEIILKLTDPKELNLVTHTIENLNKAIEQLEKANSLQKDICETLQQAKKELDSAKVNVMSKLKTYKSINDSLSSTFSKKQS